MTFLGMCLFCRSFVTNYAVLEIPLSTLIPGKGLQAHDPILWSEEGIEVFKNLKAALQSTPCLGIPDPNNSFTQTVNEKNGYMTLSLIIPPSLTLRQVFLCILEQLQPTVR